MNIPFKIEQLLFFNDQDEDKIQFYTEFPFYHTEHEQAKHIAFFRNRIEQRNNEIIELKKHKNDCSSTQRDS